MEPDHPITTALLRAAKDIRTISDQPEGTTLTTGQADSLQRAITAFGFALADYLGEATVHSQGTGYATRLLPSGAAPTAAAARILAKTARDRRLPERDLRQALPDRGRDTRHQP